jgi:hypothetical protein
MVNLAGKQRMLIQKMSKEVLLVALNIDKQNNLENLKKSKNLFAKTLKGLVSGDGDLNLVGTRDMRVIEQLGKVEKLWDDFEKTIENIIKTGLVSSSDLEIIEQNNIKLLNVMNKAVKMFEMRMGSIANKSLAKAINLSGRQRMLTQKMTKEFLFIVKNYQTEIYKNNLSKTINLFEKTLNNLIKGNEKYGLEKAPNTAIKSQLMIVKNIWNDFRYNIKVLDDNNTISNENIEYIYQNNMVLLKEMNEAVQMYEKI